MNIKQVLINSVNKPEYKPRDGQTFCNIFVNDVFYQVLKYKMFKGLTANQIIDQCVKYWAECTKESAHKFSHADKLVIAGFSNPSGHGHVAIVYPAPNMLYSGKWETDVPFVANVGKENGIMGVNFAFAEMPKYWIMP